MKKKNALPVEHRIKLSVWISQNEALLADTSDTGCAAEAAKALGFPVTACNIVSQREVIFPEMKRRSGSPLIAMTQDMERRLNERITAIERFLTTPSAQRSLTFVPASGSDVKLSVVG
jgi:hypothetical protein